MNYSQRKHLERLLERMPSPGPDPFALGPLRFSGLDVIESPDRPRYQLPEWLIPPGELLPEGLPFPPGYREEVNRWALGVCGTMNTLERGQFLVMAGRYLVGRPEDIVKLSSLSC